MRSASIALTLACLVTAPALDVHATSVAEPSAIDEIAARVPLIATGRCLSVQAEWNASKTLITTTATYDVERVIKGDLKNERLVVRQPGGTVGNITQALVGAPRFAVGERSLLFLTRDASGALRVYGLEQGKRPIRSDPRSGVDLVVVDALGGGEPRGLPAREGATGTRPAALREVPLAVVLQALVPGPRAAK